MKNQNNKHRYLAISVSCLALLLYACGGSNDQSSSGNSGSKSNQPEEINPAIESAILVSAPKESAISVDEARKKSAPGTALIIKGRIAGTAEPFSADYATFVVVDDSVMTCDREPGDKCSTPWDACCVDPQTLAASRLTIQILNSEGRPVEQSLKGVNGLKELDSVIVQGKVAEGSNESNLILNATGLFRKPASK